MNKLISILFGILILSSFSFAAKCLVDSDCIGGNICVMDKCFTPNECTTSAGCDSTEQCNRGVCISPACIVSSNCPTDQICNHGQCLPMECTDDSFCEKGFECMNYKCREVPSAPVAAPTEAPKAVSVSTAPAAAPAPTCSTQECPVATCSENKCPAVQSQPPIDFSGLPLFLLIAVIGAAVGFFAAKIGTPGDNDAKPKGPERESEDSGDEIDFDDEGSFRYI